MIVVVTVSPPSLGVQFQHIYHERNQCVNKLASLAVLFSPGLYMFQEPLIVVINIPLIITAVEEVGNFKFRFGWAFECWKGMVGGAALI
ncbi:hypothetical protein K2173_006852 [Erythroxylum novogranatense]|uniref:Uncharacterized protein n=1 Tax=Erythroxylum novogranatense TaxID=1862640 RepID=A0AAV8SY41_9ROSI|nr:hypothetical protein K2173_006852 [Erythroxylum novogranatense]